jgi:DNA repair exonuclease SbcCD ATPase subunit
MVVSISELQSRIDRLDGFYKALKNQEQDLIQEVASLKKNIDLLTKVSAVIKHLLDIMVKDEINKMAGLVTYGLKAIFEDQDLSFKPVISKKNERIYIELKTANKGVEGDFGSYGGSVAVIESFLLRVICMLKMGLARLILLDETFAPIGDEYIQNTSKLVGELSKKLGLDVLLVTHQPGFKNYANKVYRVEDSPNGLIMEREK